MTDIWPKNQATFRNFFFVISRQRNDQLSCNFHKRCMLIKSIPIFSSRADAVKMKKSSKTIKNCCFSLYRHPIMYFLIKHWQKFRKENIETDWFCGYFNIPTISLFCQIWAQRPHKYKGLPILTSNLVNFPILVRLQWNLAHCMKFREFWKLLKHIDPKKWKKKFSWTYARGQASKGNNLNTSKKRWKVGTAYENREHFV